MDAVKNFAKGTVDGAYESADTAIDVLLNHGDRFPDVPFNAVWWNATDYPDPSDDPIKEIVRVTARTGDTLTVTRAQEGTAAEDHGEAGKTYQLIAPMTALSWNMRLNGLSLQIGDVVAEQNGGYIDVDDNNGVMALINLNLATTNAIPASVAAGALVGKLPIYDSSFTLIGYIAIHSTIT